MSTDQEPYRPAMPSTALEVARMADSPSQLVALAIVNQTPPETLSKLLDLQERWEKTAARKTFVQAMSLFKAAAPAAVIKASKVDFTSQKGRTNYHYANLGDITGQLTPLMVKHDLHASWETATSDKGPITVTCHITHSAGHRESVTLCGPADPSGAKNPLQAIGSAVTYLERYKLLAALGIATADMDDDGRGAGQHIDRGYQEDRPPHDPPKSAPTASTASSRSEKTAELAKQVKAADPQGQHGTGVAGPAKPKAKTWDEILSYTLGKIDAARKTEDAMEGTALLTKVKAGLPAFRFPPAMQSQVDRAVADAEHAFSVGDAFDASNAPEPPTNIYLQSLEMLLGECATIARLDEIEQRWVEDKENVTPEVYNRGLEMIGMAQPRMIP